MSIWQRKKNKRSPNDPVRVMSREEDNKAFLGSSQKTEKR